MLSEFSDVPLNTYLLYGSFYLGFLLLVFVYVRRTFIRQPVVAIITIIFAPPIYMTWLAIEILFLSAPKKPGAAKKKFEINLNFGNKRDKE